MTEIQFSIYGDQPSPLEDPAFFLEFRSQHHVDVQVNRLAWDEAWPKLLNFALHGGGPHISQIGAIWTSPLVAMNALRPFTLAEIDALGGTTAFFAPTWQNVSSPERRLEVWGIPFTAFTYIVLYRRDLLWRAGVAESIAFQSAEAMVETLRHLRAAGISSPLVLPSGSPHRARVHIAASWIWGAGGDFMSQDGQRALFDQPEARAGLKAFFELYRYLSPADYGLKHEECVHRFAAGEAAVTIAGSSAPAVVKSQQVKNVLDNLGVAVMPGVPWVGGSAIVIWREAQMSSDRERAALWLTNFLASPSTQVRYAAASDAIPARVEALSQLKLEPALLGRVLERALRTGRSYRPTPVSVRLVNDLSRALDAVTADVLADATLDIEQALSRHVTPLAQRYSLMLAG